MYTGMNEKANPIGRSEPNRTFEFRNRPEPDAEPNRTEPRRVRTTQAEPRRSGEKTFPNRIEPNRLIFEKSGTETN